MKCKHENADHLKPGDLWCARDPRTPPWRVDVEQFRCLDCGAWLPLGPANDQPEAVRVEIRAQEIAAHKHVMEYRLSSRFKTNYGEVAGWRGEEVIESLHVIDENGDERIDSGVPLNLDSPSWRAGYLASCITERT